MRGNMMDYPLTLNHFLDRAEKLFFRSEIVSRRPDRSLHRYTYADFHRRARKLASALLKAGLKPGDRVATLMWNHYAHLECYFGVPAARGVLHTLNLRLHPSELAYIANHAEDRFVVVDDVLLPVFEQFRHQLKVEKVIVVPHDSLVGGDYKNYEEFLQQGSENYRPPEVDEHEAVAMCYTSGTTGNPKGVLYSHRALVLHSFAMAMPDTFAASHWDVVLPAQPMFHANAWAFPFAAVMLGCKLVLPGPYVNPISLLDLMQSEQVTLCGGVPTVWLAVAAALEKNPECWKLAPKLRVLVAGTACPESLMRRLDGFGMRVIHCWGMTETTPLATSSNLKPHMSGRSADEQYFTRCKQGMPSPFVDIRAVNDKGEVPWDGETMGELQVRGPWVAARYYNMPEAQDRWTDDGWLRTGDVVTIDADGFLQITDRAKDLIKSGGEWISSVDLENALAGHPAVKEAAVVGIHHYKWQERPLGVVVLNENAAIEPAALREFLGRRFAKWQLPDDFAFVDELPHTSTGKVIKAELRKRFENWQWSEASAAQQMGGR